MKKVQITILAALTLLMLIIGSGCAATQSLIKEYDTNGNLVKETTTSESVISSVVKSTANKTVIAWEDGWAAYMSISPATTEDPTPHMKMFAGKTNKGVANILPNQQFLKEIAKIIQATKSDLSVTATGIEADAKSSAKSDKPE